MFKADTSCCDYGIDIWVQLHHNPERATVICACVCVHVPMHTCVDVFGVVHACAGVFYMCAYVDQFKPFCLSISFDFERIIL